MAAHPGIPPGHPMAQMHHPTAGGPPMGPMQGQGMPPQMHPGMAPGPNGPHVTQAGQMMGGVHPGMNAGPNAMAHLQGAPQTLQGQQMGQMNPQFMVQQQQQEQMMRNRILMQQHQQQQQAQQQQRMGMLQQPGQGLNAQQYQNMQNAGHLRMNIPGQQNMQQNPMMAHMMQQQQGAGPNGPQRQAGPPGGPTPQMRAHPSMQGMQPPQQGHGPQSGAPGVAPQMRPQQSNQGSQEGQGQQHNQAQQAQQAQQQQQAQRQAMQNRPPTTQASPQQLGPQQAGAQSQPQQEHPVSAPGGQPSIGGAQEHHNRTPQQQPQPQPQQQPQHHQQGQSQQQVQHPQQAQQQAQQQQQGQQQQPQHQQQPQGPQGNNNQPNDEMRKMLSNPIANQMRQTAALNQQRQIQNLVNQNGKIKLLLFAEKLAAITGDRNSLPAIEDLQDLVSEFFVPNGTFRQISTSKGHEYAEIPTSTLARLFLMHYQSGIQNINLSVPGARSTEPNQGVQYIESHQASITYAYTNEQHIRCRGSLKALLGPHDKFESMDFEIISSEEFINSGRIRSRFSEDSIQTKSPQITKKILGPKQKAKGKTIVLNENELPFRQNFDSEGVTAAVYRAMENTTILAQMQNLFSFAHSNGIMSGKEALQKFNEATSQGQMPMPMNNVAAAQGNPQINLPPAMNGYPPQGNFAMRNPAMNPQFASPANANLGLPNAMMASPHMRPGGSPGQAVLPPHMQQGAPMGAQQMVAQQSAQGTNSAPSSNASPNAQSKKRRVSQAEPGAPQVNGIMNKTAQTPKMGVQAAKRQKAN